MFDGEEPQPNGFLDLLLSMSAPMLGVCTEPLIDQVIEEDYASPGSTPPFSGSDLISDSTSSDGSESGEEGSPEESSHEEAIILSPATESSPALHQVMDYSDHDQALYSGQEVQIDQTTAASPPSTHMQQCVDQHGRHAQSGSQNQSSTEAARGGEPDERVSTAQHWKKRYRRGDIPDSREPSNTRKSPLELAMRKFRERDTAYVISPQIGLEFDSLPEAFDFYNLYSWETGFGIRYGQSRKNTSNCKIQQEIVCGCQGKPRHQNTRSSCCGCQAMIRLHRTEDNGWYIQEFRKEHNHGLSESAGEKMHWASHRNIDNHTKKLIKNLRDNNVPLTQVYSVIGSFFGSMENVPFNKRSLRTLCAGISRDHSHDDVKKTYAYFSELKTKDPNFRDSCLSDEHGNIKALMWTNGKSRLQYKHFGDAITFDTTYRTNQYDMPFGLFVGVNQHFQSIILAGVLLTDEKQDTFEWVFKEFVALMGGTPPQTMLTDQCRAMELALNFVFPEVTHRWCKWHVIRKAKEYLGPVYSRSSGFRDEFHKILEYMLTVDEFEDAWCELITKYKLEENPFLTQIFQVREKWAKPYFAGKFCARMTSTQRSESANHMLKGFVPPGSPMNMFVRHYMKMQWGRDEEENFEEKRCRTSGVVLNTGVPIELHASKIYTHKMYELFSIALFQSGSYVVQDVIQGKSYIARHVFAERREKWSRTEFEVTYDPAEDKYSCQCGMYEHMGVLCSHAIRVMIHLGVMEIPKAHIMKRWTREAYRALPDHLSMYEKGSPAMNSTSFRHTALYMTAMEYVQLGDSNTESYEKAMNTMLGSMPTLVNISKIKDGLGLQARASAGAAGCINGQFISSADRIRISSSLRQDMIPPPTRREKGRPTTARLKPGYEVSKTRTRFCTICRSRGHRAPDCPTNKNKGKKTRRDARCSNCGLVGHRITNCVTPIS